MGCRALDGGLHIPHSVRRWPAAEKDTIDAELLRKYIFAGHVGEYMEVMEEDDNELYKEHFAKYLEHDVTHENMEETWQAVGALSCFANITRSHSLLIIPSFLICY